jgi:hypothetical protein
MSKPSKVDAADALAELRTGRAAVEAAEKQGLPVLLGAWSTLVLLDYSAKDHMPDRRARLAVSALCVTATLALGALNSRATPIQPVQVGERGSDRRATRKLAAVLLGWVVTERLLIIGLRRSRLRRPNTIAGAVLAVERPLGYLGLRRMLAARPIDV